MARILTSLPKTDIIDNLLFNGISNLRVYKARRLHLAYRLIRHSFYNFSFDRMFLFGATPEFCA